MTAGIRTTQGSPLFADHVPTDDELVIERMRAAGCVTVGKTNTPEFGAGSHTFNPVFGATCNPYDLTRSAGGSSGGAAAALAAGMVPLADGSDLGGSLRNPASFCNVVGLRPTPGTVPAWPSTDPLDVMATEGPMGRCAADVALLLGAIAGPHPLVPLRGADGPVRAARPLAARTARGVLADRRRPPDRPCGASRHRERAVAVRAARLHRRRGVPRSARCRRDVPGAARRRVRAWPRRAVRPPP